MTSFWRDGFWRTSVNGNVHWVEGHGVQRDDWERTTFRRGNDFLLRHARAHVGTTSRLVIPNAECPVCGEPVFFYQNVHGSRVFFDELGPPWPKHPCTLLSTVSGVATPIAPSQENLRSQDDIEFIQRWDGHDSEAMFADRYGTGRWDIATFITSYAAPDFCVIVLGTSTGYRYLLAESPTPVSMRPGQLVTYYTSWISYLDTTSLSAVEIKLRRVGAKHILNKILGVN